MADQVEKTDDEWRSELSAAEYHVLREAGTERPFSHSYDDDPTVGVYECRGCGAELFRSETKFDAQCGWPSFYTPLAGDRGQAIEYRALGGVRSEVRRANCAGGAAHLGAHPSERAILDVLH